MGGLARLIEQSQRGGEPISLPGVLWEPEPPTSWWYLAVSAPHAYTPVDLLHTRVGRRGPWRCRGPLSSASRGPGAVAARRCGQHVAHPVLGAPECFSRHRSLTTSRRWCSCRWSSARSCWPARGDGGSIHLDATAGRTRACASLRAGNQSTAVAAP
jgi:hypothetical protein